jgi:ubiquitin carboxyl-terminal hydrolase 48
MAKHPRDEEENASVPTPGQSAPGAASGGGASGGRRRKRGATGTTKREAIIHEAADENNRWAEWMKDPSAAVLEEKFWHSNKPACSRKQHETKQNCHDNPSCVWGLGEHKNGVWAKSPASLDAIERPSGTLRAPLALQALTDLTDAAAAVRDATPVGLRNLGATCYVNSILQVLFMNSQFRSGIFECGYKAPEPPPPLEQQQKDEEAVQRVGDQAEAAGLAPSTAVEIDVDGDDGDGAAAAEPVRHDAKKGVLCSQLQRLFACLQDSVLSSFTPSEMVTSMGLSTAYQQDVGEFYKLLLSSLERELAQAPCAKVKDLVQNLYQGKFRHVTTCQGCKKESEMSAKELPFYELQMQPKDGGSLEQSLQEYLAEERLDGDNKYLCSHCNKKQVAVRKNELVSCELPSAFRCLLESMPKP